MEIESGLQLLARLGSRPTLERLNSVLFPEGLRPREVAEISGNESSGKTLLIMQLLAECLLPPRHKDVPIDGSGAGAMLINTDHHFSIVKLAEIMLRRIERSCVSGNLALPAQDELDAMINGSLENLIVVNCYDSSQLLLTLQSFETVLSRDDRIAFIAIDSVSAYYWQDRECGEIRAKNLYLKNMLKLIQRHTSGFKVVTIYTKPDHFLSKGWETMDCAAEPTAGRINYRIQLYRKENSDGFSATIESATMKKTIGYSICDHGIKWITD